MDKQDGKQEMDGHNSEISSVLQEFRQLLINHEESKKQQVKLRGLVESLRDTLKVARDAGHNAEMKRNKSLRFVAQQQEVIVKLLHIKEENSQLRETISLMESRLAEMQISRVADQEKKDSEVNGIKEEYFKELMKAQENGDVRVKKLEKEIDLEIQGLQSEIESRKKEIDEQLTKIQAMRAEIIDLKEKATKDLEAYHDKLAEHDKVHQAELETWKVANMKTTYNQNYSAAFPRFALHHLQEMPVGSAATYGHPEANSYYRHRLLQNNMTRLYRHDFPNRQNHYESQLPDRTGHEHERFQDNLVRQEENVDFCQTKNNLDSHLPGPDDRETADADPKMLAPRFQESGNPQKFPVPTRAQNYPKLPLISRSHNAKSVFRAVRPLPRPKGSADDSAAGFRKAGDIYLEDKASEKCEGSGDKPPSDKPVSELEKCSVKMPAKRRKLFNSKSDSLL